MPTTRHSGHLSYCPSTHVVDVRAVTHAISDEVFDSKDGDPSADQISPTTLAAQFALRNRLFFLKTKKKARPLIVELSAHTRPWTAGGAHLYLAMFLWRWRQLPR